jgi:hypothetical protein
METFHESIQEYKKQLEKGAIQKAYKGLMEYVMQLRAYLKNKYPDYFVSGSIYFGYMDMTYFSFYPKEIKDRNLKIAIVFLHETCRFEVWLAGMNKQIQVKYWNLLRDSGWQKYPVVPTTQGADAIIEHVVAGDPDFRDLDALTTQIEGETLKFIREVESFFAEH